MKNVNLQFLHNTGMNKFYIVIEQAGKDNTLIEVSRKEFDDAVADLGLIKTMSRLSRVYYTQP